MSNRLGIQASRLHLKAMAATRLAIVSTLMFFAASVFAQSPVREYRHNHERPILAEFTQLLAIPNVASDRQNIRRNADLILEMMRRRELNPRLLETANKESPPAVYGEWKIPGATHSIVFYAHYDGQPTEAKQWSGTLPWQPTWRSAPLEAGGKIVTKVESVFVAAANFSPAFKVTAFAFLPSCLPSAFSIRAGSSPSSFARIPG